MLRPGTGARDEVALEATYRRTLPVGDGHF
jgi:hypothetical protein